MCKLLKISRSLVYYKFKVKSYDSQLEDQIISIFKSSRNNYGTRKIKKELAKLSYQVSRRRIGVIMEKYELIFQYTIKQFKVYKSKCNEEKVANREFNSRDEMEVVVSDLTYVNVKETLL